MSDSALSTVDGRSLRYRGRRDELLRALTEYVLDHGIADLSLRKAATEVGVSHSSLLRHFESKDTLVDSVIETLRNDLLERDSEAGNRSGEEAVRRLWAYLRAPAQRRQFLVLFEVVAARARAGRESDLASTLVEDLLAPIETTLRRDGVAERRARPLATAILAMIRGLQLDLALTGDLERADAAMEEFIDLLETRGAAPVRSETTTGNPAQETLQHPREP